MPPESILCRGWYPETAPSVSEREREDGTVTPLQSRSPRASHRMLLSENDPVTGRVGAGSKHLQGNIALRLPYRARADLPINVIPSIMLLIPGSPTIPGGSGSSAPMSDFPFT